MATILIVGGTGNQGGAAINALLATDGNNLKIRALTRNPESEASKRLQSKGIQIYKGNLSDRDSLVNALQGVSAVHLVTDFRGPKGADGEIEEGKLFIDCAVSTGVKYVVFSSVAASGTATKVPHFHSKHVIETYLKSSGLSYTILKPTNFMENTPPPGIGRFFFLGGMRSMFGTDKIYHIAVEDIGKVVAAALLDQEKFHNKSIDLVGDVKSADEMKNSLDKGEGYVSWRAWIPRSLILSILPSEFWEMATFLSTTYANNEMPGSVEELKGLIPDVVDIETWSEQQRLARNSSVSKKDV